MGMRLERQAEEIVALRIQFQCSLEDFREAQSTHAVATGQQPRSRRGLVLALVVLAIALVTLVLLRASPVPRATYLVSDPAHAEPAPAVAPMTAWRFIRGEVPALALALLFLLPVLRQMVRKPPAPWALSGANGKRTGIRKLTMLGAFVAIGGGLFYFMNATSEAAPALDVLPPLLPIAMVMVGFIVIARLAKDRMLRNRWEAQPAMQRPYAMEITADWVVLEEPLARHDYRWGALPGFRETENLFLLYVSPLGFWMVPKRAFSRQEDLEAFKGILLTQVRDGEFLAQPSAFPITPVAPLPAIPVEQGIQGQEAHQ